MAEWESARKGKIGGGAAADILGVGYHTPYQRWLILTGRVREAPPTGPWVKWGNDLEPVLAGVYARETGRRPGYDFLRERTGCGARHLVDDDGGLHLHVTDAEHPFLVGSPDAIVPWVRPVEGSPMADPGAYGVVDFKATTVTKSGPWLKHGPELERFWTQTAHYAGILGLPWVSLGGFTGIAHPLHVLDRVLDPDALAEQRERLIRFWFDHVVANVPPPVDGAPETRRLLVGSTDPAAREVVLPGAVWRRLDEEREAAAETVRAAKLHLARAEHCRDILSNAIGTAMNGAKVATIPNVARYTASRSLTRAKAR